MVTWQLHGSVFLSQIYFLDGAIQVGAGFYDNQSDEVEIDFDKLDSFLAELVKRFRLDDSSSITPLLRGLVVHSVALLDCGKKAGFSLQHQIPADWIEEAKELATHSMHSIF